MRAASGPMSGAKHAEKKRKRVALFPQQQAAVRQKDVQRKWQAATAKLSAATRAVAKQTYLEQQQQYFEADRRAERPAVARGGLGGA